MEPNSINDILNSLARLLAENKSGILAANAADLDACPADDAVILDRLKADPGKIDNMIMSVRRVIDAPAAAGTVISSHVRGDGLRVENRRVPFGTILIIYEARPDVSIEAAAIALKAGNRILLKGGREARNTNLFLASLWEKALAENDAETQIVRYLDLSRDDTQKLICGEGESFDLVIPRGGEALIDLVVKNSKAPVIISGRGNNFLFIDEEADPAMATKIAIDGKSRLSVCNALDKILVHRRWPDVASRVRKLAGDFHNMGVEVIGDAEACAFDASIRPIESEAMWHEEFLAAKIVIGVAADACDAIRKINQYSGGHSAAIVTANAKTAAEFLENVDCAAVYHNASVRFTDGGEFGLGAEIAISTQKLHFRGPLGAEHLLTNKWYVLGDGQVRG